MRDTKNGAVVARLPIVVKSRDPNISKPEDSEKMAGKRKRGSVGTAQGSFDPSAPAAFLKPMTKEEMAQSVAAAVRCIGIESEVTGILACIERDARGKEESAILS